MRGGRQTVRRMRDRQNLTEIAEAGPTIDRRIRVQQFPPTPDEWAGRCDRNAAAPA